MTQPNQTSPFDGEIIPPRLAVRAMRDSGYRNTAYALAELIDNSVQAQAHDVDIVCVETQQLISQRLRRRLTQVSVLDNGTGMTPDILRLALQFGNGTHLNDRSGIGRFGMGLPNSSISQCRRVQVWTWQNGPDNAAYAYLDVDDIETGKLKSIPVPYHQPLPPDWRSRSHIVGTSGTLVLWDKLEDHRLTWRGARATLRNTEILIGRMYRKFIDDGRLQVRLLALEDGRGTTMDTFARVNDPLYLMKGSSTPSPFDAEPMFQPWGESDEVIPITYDERQHEVVIRMSWARPETVPEDTSDRGAKPYGKHAAKNLGVSILRAGRELDLDSGWTNSYEPTERWWGMEIEFPPALDEVFGVTNNKQSATIFSQMAQFDWEAEADPGEPKSNFQERIQLEGDPKALLMPIVAHMRDQIGQVRKKLKTQTKGKRKTNERHDKPGPEDLATRKGKERAEQGHATESDDVPFTEDDRHSLEENLRVDKDYPSDVARAIANATLERGRKVVILTKAMDGYAFFNVEHPQGGLTAIVFNTNHPFYEGIMETLRPDIGEESDADLIDRINQAADTLELLFAAWARYEIEEIGRQEVLFDVRQEWGKMARFFLSARGT